MNKTIRLLRYALPAASILLILSTARQASAVDALLLQDTYVDSGSANTNFGSGSDLRVFKSSTRSMRAFLKFTTETVPPGTTASNVIEARLRLWVNGSTTIRGAITMTPVTSAWSELLLKSNTSGTMTFGSPKVADLPISNSPQFVSIDVTDWVKAWIGGTLPNEGFQVEASATTSSLNLYFDTKESTLTSHEPRLEIVLGSVGPQGPAGPAGPQGPQGTTGLTGGTGAVGPAGPPGQTGATGSQGLVGPAGAAGPAGPVGSRGMNWKEGWSNSAAYNVDDAVSFSGSAYIALQANSNTQPPAAGVWTLLAQKGDAGAAGAQGVPGLQGPIGPTGLTGPQGDLGPQGPSGPNGDPGPPGSAGAQGPVGPPGPVLTHIEPQGDLEMGEFIQGTPP